MEGFGGAAGEVSLISKMPRCRVWYITDAAVIGRRGFVDEIFRLCRDRLGPQCKDGAWKDFAFYQVPAESGLRVSGVMRDGKVRWVTYMRDGKVLRQSSDRETLVIRGEEGGSLSLKPDRP